MSSESTDQRFERVLSAHGPALERIAATYARPGADHADLLQDILVAVWRALDGFRGESQERTFVFRIAHNRGISRIARRREHGDDSALDAVVDQAPAPDTVVAARQTAERLFVAVRALPLGQRQVLSLALEETSQSECAEILGISEENVAVRLHRARKALRALLDGGSGETTGEDRS